MTKVLNAVKALDDLKDFSHNQTNARNQYSGPEIMLKMQYLQYFAKPAVIISI